MSAHCCSTPSAQPGNTGYRRVLWIALLVNAAMFLVEIAAGAFAGSAALLADALDFFGDAANYGASLVALSLVPVWRSRVALIKGCTMGIFGILVLGKAGWNAITGAAPEPLTMGTVAILALTANVGVAVILYRFRSGDANMRSVWLCSRNDAIGNVAVMLAALGVFGLGNAWPDLAVAAILGALAVSSAISIVRHALREISEPDAAGLRFGTDHHH